VISEIEHLAGSQASTVVQTVQNPIATNAGTVATLMGVVTLIFGTFGVFQHLQDALNAIWRVRPKPTKGWWEFTKYRLFSLATVVVTGFLLLVSLIASSVLSWAGAQAVHRLGLPIFSLQIVENLLSLIVITFLFAMIFKLLPDTTVRWRHVWLGAFVTAELFTIGKTVLGLYLGRASVTSAYGAAGSLIALLLWCYYAAQIVFLGAEFTRVTSMSNGGRNFAPLEAAGERSREL
jgi:membrane protein